MPSSASASNGVSQYRPIGFITIVDVERAKEFYRDKLGLRLVSEEPPFAIVFETKGMMLRLVIGKQIAQSAGTVFGWEVPDVASAAVELAAAGIRFEIYEFLKQDASGVWTAPGGAKIAWFRDPDGNILSISEHPQST